LRSNVDAQHGYVAATAGFALTIMVASENETATIGNCRSPGPYTAKDYQSALCRGGAPRASKTERSRPLGLINVPA